MDHVHHLSVEKITKMLDRGLDPNYHDLDTGGMQKQMIANNTQIFN